MIGSPLIVGVGRSATAVENRCFHSGTNTLIRSVRRPRSQQRSNAPVFQTDE
jgi:hypothetical protein